MDGCPHFPRPSTAVAEPNWRSQIGKQEDLVSTERNGRRIQAQLKPGHKAVRLRAGGLGGLDGQAVGKCECSGGEGGATSRRPDALRRRGLPLGDSSATVNGTATATVAAAGSGKSVAAGLTVT